MSSWSDSVLTPSPRLCVLKREEGESYGFHLRIEKGRQGHIIRNVATFGVAERSGLGDGDRLLEVNNHFVDDVSHPEVRYASCEMIHYKTLQRTDGIQTRLLYLSLWRYRWPGR